MRAIKFRAWDKIDHEMYKENKKLSRMTYYANPCVYDDGWLQFEVIGQDAIGDCPNDRFELMQFTGLKDKNGVEIYEGDIVRIDKHYEGDYKCGGSNWQVIFEGGCFTLNGDYVGDFISDCFNAIVEVIGNIYENPELLKETK